MGTQSSDPIVKYPADIGDLESRQVVTREGPAPLPLYMSGPLVRFTAGEKNANIEYLGQHLYSVEQILGADGTAKLGATPAVAATFAHDTGTENLLEGFKKSSGGFTNSDTPTGYLPVSGDSILTVLDKLTKQVAYNNYVMNRQGGILWQDDNIGPTNTVTTSDQYVSFSDTNFFYIKGANQLRVFITGIRRAIGIDWEEDPAIAIGAQGTRIKLKANEYPPNKMIDIECFSKGGNFNEDHTHSEYAGLSQFNGFESRVAALESGGGDLGTAIDDLEISLQAAIALKLSINNPEAMTGVILSLSSSSPTAPLHAVSLSAMQTYVTSQLAPMATEAWVSSSYATTAQVNAVLPAGGSAGQVLTETGSGIAWQAAPSSLPASGNDNDILTKAGTVGNYQSIGSLLDLVSPGGTVGDALVKTASGVEWATPVVDTGTSAIGKTIQSYLSTEALGTSYIGNGFAASDDMDLVLPAGATSVSFNGDGFYLASAGGEAYSYHCFFTFDTATNILSGRLSFSTLTVAFYDVQLTSSPKDQSDANIGVFPAAGTTANATCSYNSTTRLLKINLQYATTTAGRSISITGSTTYYDDVVIEDGNTVFGARPGTSGQQLIRTGAGATDFGWADAPVALPPGGTTGQALVKSSNTDGDTQWSSVSSGGGGSIIESQQYAAAAFTGGSVGSGWNIPLTVLSYDTRGDQVNLVTDAMYSRKSGVYNVSARLDITIPANSGIQALSVQFYIDGVASGIYDNLLAANNTVDAFQHSLNISAAVPVNSGSFIQVRMTHDMGGTVVVAGFISMALTGWSGSFGQGNFLPSGGTAGQVLSKIDAAEGNSQWITAPVPTNYLKDDADDSTTGTLTAAGFNISSDKRLKEDVTEISYGLKEILSLDPVSYKFINKETTELGLIAQEIEDLLPELVHESNGFLAVNYIGLIPILIKAVQELAAKVK